ncbi:alanine racemase [Arthrobacter sp. UYEF20]
MNSQDPMQHVRSPVQDVGSWLEIDGAAFEANVRNLPSMIDDRALLCAVVKSNAYGHGADLLLPFLVRLGVPFIGVGSNEEADTARRCGFEGRILRVRAAAPQEIKAGLRHDIEELIADPQSAWEIHKIATDAGKVVASTSTSTLPGSAGTASMSRPHLAGHPRLRSSATGGFNWPE